MGKFWQENSSLNGQGGFSWCADQSILQVLWGMGSAGQEMYWCQSSIHLKGKSSPVFLWNILW